MPRDTTTSLLNRFVAGLRLTLVLATLAHQISMAAAALAASSSAAGGNRLAWAPSNSGGGEGNASVSAFHVEAIKMSFNESDTNTMVDEIAANSSSHHHRRIQQQQHQHLTNRRIQPADTGGADKITPKFSSLASSPSSASTLPTITSTLPSSSSAWAALLTTTGRVVVAATSRYSTPETSIGQQQQGERKSGKFYTWIIKHKQGGAEGNYKLLPSFKC